jgi:hypothetical protein
MHSGFFMSQGKWPMIGTAIGTGQVSIDQYRLVRTAARNAGYGRQMGSTGIVRDGVGWGGENFKTGSLNHSDTLPTR